MALHRGHEEQAYHKRAGNDESQAQLYDQDNAGDLSKRVQPGGFNCCYDH